MIAALTAAWSWFVGTKVGRWIVELVAILAGFGAALGYVYFKGKHAQAAKDQAKDAKVAVEAAQVAQQVQTDASAAVAEVQADAAKQPAPDTESRDDLNTTF